MKKIVIVLYGPPGGGKGTQARLLANKFGLVHIDTGQLLEAIVHDPHKQKEKIIRRERALFDAGTLMTPSFVLRQLILYTRHLAQAGIGIVFSGSPRTMHEAQKLLPTLARSYGKKHIFFVVLKVSPDVSTRRNTSRLVCRTCRQPFLSAYVALKNPKHCVSCGGEYYRRTLDKKEVQQQRIREYNKRTKPIFEFVKQQGYVLKVVDAEGSPAHVFAKINDYLKKAGGH